MSKTGKTFFSTALLYAGLLFSLSIDAAEYRDSEFPGWQEIIFSGNTIYKQNNDCIQATSKASASGLIKEQRSKLNDESMLVWSWKAEKLLHAKNAAKEREKRGDDFLARIYVIHEGTFFWQTKAVNYVWSKEHELGSHWPNPFTKNARMVVVQSGEEGLGRWNTFERNIKDDFKKYFDMDIEKIDAIALMTDTDNTGGVAEACYRLPSLMN